MSKAPWEENNFEIGGQEMSRTKQKTGALSMRILTVLAVIFFIILLACIFIVIYTSTGGSHPSEVTESFNQTVPASEPATPASTETVASEASEFAEGETITVEPGEGAASIAARAGISIAELEALNPEHMTTGSWYANPGDVIKIK